MYCSVRITRFLAVFSLFLLLILGNVGATADQVAMTYTFDHPNISSVKIEGERYDRIAIEGCTNGGLAGEPALPSAGARILIPYGAAIELVEVIAGDKVLLGSDYLVEPVAEPSILSDGPQAALAPSPDMAIYGSDAPFPVSEYEQIGVFGFRGYQILVLRLQPVQYLPTSGTLIHIPELRVVIHTSRGQAVSPLFRGLEKDALAVKSKVDNPEAAASYPVNAGSPRAFDLLILTTTSLESSFAPLESYHDGQGISTEIHTTADVGSSDPADVRDYIRNRYLNDGIEYVIIGADDDIIPAQDLYVDSQAGYIEYNMPGDIYYGCLDGTWNNDGDGNYGETNDGAGGGDVDMVAEVYVGRAAAGNATEAGRFVTKTLWYLQGQHGEPQKVLLVGEHLGFGGVSEYAAATLEELENGASTHGYTTVGIPTSEYTIEELFERDMSWSQSTLVSRINNSVHILDHLGHGSEDYAMKLYNSDITSDLTNTNLCFVYSQTCLAGHFDGTDCWAETMNIKTDNGGFAVVMNARYGWGEYDSTDGPSQRFNREFWDAVFDEGMPEISKANQDSKEDNLYRINEACMRWCTYELNLFGDPTVPVQGAEITGLKVSPSDSLDSEGQSGGPFIPSSKIYMLVNNDATGINYTVSKTASWITLSNTSGYLAGGGSTTVAVSINSNANSLADGGYSDTVSFVNTTNHDGDTTRIVNLQVGVPVMQYEWSMDSNPGWTTQSQWAWGQPTGGGGEYGNSDPTSGHTGSNVYGYNLSGDYANSMAEQHLTSTAIDCSELDQVSLRFWRYLNVEQPSYDHAYVRVSNDGSSWTTVWENTAEVTDGSWTEVEYDISSVADGAGTVYLRWTMGSTDTGWTYSGWNIDDVQIFALGGGTIPDEDTLAVTFNCVPDSGTVPFTSQFWVGLSNLVSEDRRAAARIDAVIASGSSYSNWKSGWTNLSALEEFSTFWNQSIPALGSVIGTNVFTLSGEDVTPAPFNQPPYQVSGDTDAAACTVTGIAP